MTTTGGQEMSGHEIVQVPVPKHLLAAVYRVLADGMVPPTEGDGPANAEFPTQVQRTKRNMIDLIVEVARRIGAEQHPVSLKDLHNAYLQANPGIGKGNTSEGFNATIHFHTVNIRSRFPDKDDHQRPAQWLSRPTFKRVAHGQYMLLSDEEMARFRRGVDQNDPVVYADEYDVTDLTSQE